MDKEGAIAECKYCGGESQWKNIGGCWKLVNDDNQVHYCEDYKVARLLELEENKTAKMRHREKAGYL
jgi:hypothetical protein